MNEKLTNCFVEALGIEPTIINDELAYRAIKEWDSVAHMALIAVIEAEFDIMLDTNDIIDMSSVGKAKSILGKYGVAF
jgi:acyl carrier protein